MPKMKCVTTRVDTTRTYAERLRYAHVLVPPTYVDENGKKIEIAAPECFVFGLPATPGPPFKL